MHKTYTSKQVADFVGGVLTGNENIELNYLGPPSLADENVLAIAFEKEHMETIGGSKAICFLVPEGVKVEGKTWIEVGRPKLAMGKLLNMFYVPPEAPEGIHPTAFVSPTAKLGQNISVGPNASVGSNTVIGDNTKILANVSIGSGVNVGSDCLFHQGVCIGDRVQIGKKVIINFNASIGSDGFSFVTEKASNIETARESGELGKTANQVIVKIPSCGSVLIEDDVEIGAGTCIDRGTIQNTIIGRNTKIDNLVQIGHNCEIGKSCFLAGQVGIAGSTKVGNRCVLAGQVGLRDHIEIGDDVILIAQAGVSKSLEPKAIYAGTPAVTRKEFAKQLQSVKSIPEMKERLKALEKALIEKEKV